MRDKWDEMHDRLMSLTVSQLRAIARDEGISLGYDGGRKDSIAWAIVSTRRHREAQTGKGSVA